MDNLIALVPSIGIGILFVLVIRYFLRADRIEREEMAKLDAQRPDRRDAAAPSAAPENSGNDGSGTAPATPAGPRVPGSQDVP